MSGGREWLEEVMREEENKKNVEKLKIYCTYTVNTNELLNFIDMCSKDQSLPVWVFNRANLIKTLINSTEEGE